MASENNDPGLVETIIENVKSAFGGDTSNDTELVAEARGEGAGDTSGTDADVNMLGTKPDPTVSRRAEDRAQPGTPDSGSAGTSSSPSFETSRSESGFATESADPYANTPGTGFATGMVTTPVDPNADFGDERSSISTEPSLGDGDAGVTEDPELT